MPRVPLKIPVATTLFTVGKLATAGLLVIGALWVLQGGGAATVPLLDFEGPTPPDALGGESGPNSSLTQTVNESKAERLLFEKINEKRTEQELSRLSRNQMAHQAADRHAEDMAQNEYFSHTAPDGETQTQRYAFCNGGENIAQTWVFENVDSPYGGVERYTSADELSSAIVKQWMHSDPHRVRGIYGENWRTAGPGIAITPNGKVYAVMGFCA